MRILTLNIWNLDGDWKARRPAVLSVLRQWEPDVVCLQEVVETGKANQAEWLAVELGAWHVAFASVQHHSGPARFGNAVLSRWPIDAEASAQLPHEPDDAEVQRVVAHARTNGIDVFSTHLAWQLHDAALRERQVQALVKFVNDRRDPNAAVGPVIAGDFNAEPDSTAVRFLTGLTSLDGVSTYFQDAWRPNAQAERYVTKPLQVWFSAPRTGTKWGNPKNLERFFRFGPLEIAVLAGGPESP